MLKERDGRVTFLLVVKKSHPRAVSSHRATSALHSLPPDDDKREEQAHVHRVRRGPKARSDEEKRQTTCE